MAVLLAGFQQCAAVVAVLPIHFVDNGSKSRSAIFPAVVAVFLAGFQQCAAVVAVLPIHFPDKGGRSGSTIRAADEGGIAPGPL